MMYFKQYHKPDGQSNGLRSIEYFTGSHDVMLDDGLIKTMLFEEALTFYF